MYLSAFARVGEIHVIDIPAANNQIVGVDQGDDALERHMHLVTLRIAANTDRRCLQNVAVVVMC